ncbi:MAG TPA: YceI family protein [Solirubrobacteraceae bacterium]|jgi:polyisoprenoid-binding protein YceI
MPIPSGKHALGPQDAELLVHTRRTGAAAKAGHDLVIEVASWSGTLEIGQEPTQSSVILRADGGSLQVREGTGGMTALGDEEKANITKTIDDEVLKQESIEFRSTAVNGDGERLQVQGELELMGQRRPVQFELTISDDGKLTGSATIKQSDWGIKPYSILFGTMKVVDEVVVTIEGNLKS